MLLGLISFLWADFSANVLVSANSGSHNKMPDIIVDGNGTIHVVWINNDDNKNYVLCEASEALKKKIIQNYYSNSKEFTNLKIIDTGKVVYCQMYHGFKSYSRNH